jgi:hypothetical protein
MWVSELESAQLGTLRIGVFVSEQEAYDSTDKWLREHSVSFGKTKKTMLELVEEDFSCEVYIYEDIYAQYDWEEDYDLEEEEYDD